MYLFTGTAQSATVSTTGNTAVKFLMAGTHVSHTAEQATAIQYNYY